MCAEIKQWNVIPGGVTAPQGFQAAGVAAQVRKKGRRDLALISSQVPARAAGIYTQNQVQAAPVLVTKENLSTHQAQAIVCNSGIANACVGVQGRLDARTMAVCTAEALGIAPDLVAVASTGVIGMLLPMDKVTEGIREAAALLSTEGGTAAAEAIMTTDTAPKESAVRFTLRGKVATIGGCAKGSGMIHPNMATMLGFITTDADVETELLQETLRWVADRSFNCVTIDGDTSTNDMVILLANGMAGNETIKTGDSESAIFREALLEVCIKLAKMIAGDGEGATKFLEVRVDGAASEADARQLARAVVGSNLVKAAIFGEDPNWGRVICAAGYAGVPFDPNLVDIWLGDLKVAADGTGLDFNEEKATEVLSGREVYITLNMKQGYESAFAWGCDLSFDYVRINGQYRT
jgi:glutamate N-acetyltransferase/amino-acid N-acetyltransferase